MLLSSIPLRPLKTITHQHLAYLVGLETAYIEMGYVTNLKGRALLLEIYPEGSIVPKTREEEVIEKWID